MDIDEFMDMSKPIRRRVIQGSTNNAYRPVNTKDVFKVQQRKQVGKDYSKTLKAEQDLEMEKMFMSEVDENCSISSISSMSNVKEMDGACGIDTRVQSMRELYNRYEFKNRPQNLNLPIHSYSQQIMNAIKQYPVSIIKGETGCGKSTQVPQFILKDAYDQGEYCNIVVTQPRRIAATSLATQVASERGCTVNTLVGYQIGLEREASEDTRLLFCTTGVLLQKLVTTKNMSMFTHIILDEVHERDEEMEFLLIVIKRFLIRNPNSTKIILMSATINTEEFSQYFSIPLSPDSWIDAPTIDLDAARQFKVNVFYLEDLQKFKRRATIDYNTPGIDSSMYAIACILVLMYTRPEYAKNGNCILIFLPGIHEISEMCRALENEQKNTPLDKRVEIQILPLHSTISSDQQRNVFIRAAPNCTKIILATNIAESSITVPDVKYVIDFCLTRVLEADPSTGFSTLKLKWASQNSCIQRAGRTGRTMNGRCYRLVSRHFFEREMLENDPPALIRCPLERIVLKAKMIEPDLPPRKIIGLAIEPPDLTDITYTVMNLKEARGLHLNVGRRYIEDDGDLTFMGRIMDALPLDVRATRMIVLGYVFNVMEECIIIAAGITVQKVFTLNMKDPMRTYSQKLTFADGSGSDLIAILHAYQYWLRKIHDNNYFTEANRIKAAERYSLDLKGLYEMYHLIGEINKRLEPFKLADAEGVTRHRLSPKEKNIVIKVCIAGAFYPNFFVRSSCSNVEEKERDMYHELNGRDPCTTVYYRGLDSNQLGYLYQNQIKEYLRSRKIISSFDDVKVSVDPGSEKVFLTFLGKQGLLESGKGQENAIQDEMPGRIKTQVYKTIKLARERDRLMLKIMEENEMEKYAEEFGIEKYEDAVFNPDTSHLEYESLCVLPNRYIFSMVGQIGSVTTPNKFWFKPIENQNDEIMAVIKNKINNTELTKISDGTDLIGKIVAAKVYATNDESPNEKTKRFFRAKVLSIIQNNQVHERRYQYKILLIDEGNEPVVDLIDLYSIDDLWICGAELGIDNINQVFLKKIPPRAFECTLAEIQPSYVDSPSGKWTKDAVEQFKKYISDASEIIAEVYSVWNGVVSVDLRQHPESQTASQMLLSKQHAQRSEESYPSKHDHAVRFKAQHFEKFNEIENGSQDHAEFLKEFFGKPFRAPEESQCNRLVQLKGPYSPLETKIHGCTRSGAGKLPSIERFSVNNVLLDTDPQDPCERLIVASSIGRNSNNSDIILRNTTIMPNIHGFAIMMAMLFGPIIEVHRDNSKTRYNSVLCGLGYDKTSKKSYYEEHDLVLNFDVHMDKDDMTMINKIRYTMTSLLHTLPGEVAPNIEPKGIASLKIAIIKDLLQFLQKPRRSLDIRNQYVNEFDWGCIDEPDLMFVEGAEQYEDRATFPSFRFMRLSNVTNEDITKYQENNQALYAIAFCNAPINPMKHVVCLLCSTNLTSVPAIRNHIFTKLHKDRAEQCNARFDMKKYETTMRSDPNFKSNKHNKY